MGLWSWPWGFVPDQGIAGRREGFPCSLPRLWITSRAGTVVIKPCVGIGGARHSGCNRGEDWRSGLRWFGGSPRWLRVADGSQHVCWWSPSTNEHLRILLDDDINNTGTAPADVPVPALPVAAPRSGRIVALQKQDGRGIRALVLGEVLWERHSPKPRSTHASTKARPRVLRAASEVDPGATILTVDAIGACDHVSEAMLASLHAQFYAAARLYTLVYKRHYGCCCNTVLLHVPTTFRVPWPQPRQQPGPSCMTLPLAIDPQLLGLAALRFGGLGVYGAEADRRAPTGFPGWTLCRSSHLNSGAPAHSLERGRSRSAAFFLAATQPSLHMVQLALDATLERTLAR